MAEVIQQRKKDIGQIESIMQNINAIAKDINVEVQAQGEKLERLDQHMRTAADNVVGAKGELTEASAYQKKSGKCLLYLIIAMVIVLGLILFFVIRSLTA